MFHYHAQTTLKNSFRNSGAILWNSLPYDVRQAESLGQFKLMCTHTSTVRHGIHGKQLFLLIFISTSFTSINQRLGSAFGRIAYEHENEVCDNEVQSP